MDRKDWILNVYSVDKRCKSGERLHGKYRYYDKTRENMAAEVFDLCRVYPSYKFRIEVLGNC
jgi:hypothetical protein